MSAAWLAPRRIAGERMALCQACPLATGGRKRKFFCSECKCLLEGITRSAGDACPLGKWHPYQPSGAKP